jgi:prevent-host-death family protein
MLYNNASPGGAMTDYEKPKGKGAAYVREAAAAYAPSQGGAEWVSAADFKAHCLSLIDRVRQERSEVVVTRYGKPVARLVPFEQEPPAIVGFLAGTVTSYGDLVSPVGEEWEADA